MKLARNYKIFADRKIQQRLGKPIPGRTQAEKEDSGSLDLRLIGALWETPPKIPFLLSGYYQFIPHFFRRWLRAGYGAWTLVFEKLSANKNQALLELLERIQTQNERLAAAERRIAVLEGHKETHTAGTSRAAHSVRSRAR